MSEWTFETLKEHFEQARKSDQAALALQAAEYERRLLDLNHAHEKAVEVQHTYVTQDKYEDRLAAEKTAREIALARIDEKFDDYVKRYEQDKRDLDVLMAANKAAADATAKAAEESARKVKEATEAQGRTQNRNLVILGIVLTTIVAVANFVAPHII